ncbi:MAG: FAD-dependent oxidoreductase [Cyanobacteriota bacterium]|nr:FAD-dependent oxidoreductase [Cyanobacteriota bacterium]
MRPAPPSGPEITVIGDGLAGSVLALCLAQGGARVRLIGAERPMATALSYGALPRGAPSRAWRRLERRHGPLGWRPSGLVFHDQRAGLPAQLAALTRAVPLPLARVDAARWLAARGPALEAAGVHQLTGRIAGLQALAGGGWRLEGIPGAWSAANTVVLAAGASARRLWPTLPSRLRHSWAGVLHLETLTGAEGAAQRWLEQARRGRIVQPRHWRRPALEAACATCPEPRWIVDAGLAPLGEGVVVGQISLIPPAEAPAASGGGLEPPDPQWMEARLREGLGALDPHLAALEAPYRQVPVSFCQGGQPLAGPVAEAPGLWVFAGFSAAFSRVPRHAEQLAQRMLASLR